jgi:hypothetical protein
MEEFRIHEISAVDHPAQEGAKVAIMKRRASAATVRAREQPPVFMKRVAEIRRRDGCDGVTAMRRARREYPAELAAMQKQTETFLLDIEVTDDGMRLARPAAWTQMFDQQEMAGAAKRKTLVRGPDKFGRIVDGIMQDEGVTRTEAWRLAARRNPELLAAMQRGEIVHEVGKAEEIDEEEAEERLAELEERRRGRAGHLSASKFMELVSKVRARDGCSRTEAMSRARREYPGEFADFQMV